MKLISKEVDNPMEPDKTKTVYNINLVLDGPELSTELQTRINQLNFNLQKINDIQKQLNDMEKMFLQIRRSTQATCEHSFDEPINVGLNKWKRICKACFFEETNSSVRYKSTHIPVWKEDEEQCQS